MTLTRHELRALTLADNFAWLQGFGCHVERRRHLIYVHHPELPEYSTWLLLEPEVDALRQLIDRSGDEGAGVDVFVDDEATTPEIASLLASRFRLVGANVTTAARLGSRHRSSRVSLVAAAANEAPAWSDLYSQGFARSPSQAAVDRRRWTLSFSAPTIQHWFLLDRGERIGVCQTTRSAVAGVYSFTLLPDRRRGATTLLAARAVLARAHEAGAEWIYFETLRSGAPRAAVKHGVGPLLTVRSLTGYAVIGEEG